MIRFGAAKPTATVIWFHGLGDSPAGWASFCKGLERSLPHVRWILPKAPVQPVSCNGGYEMTSWMDLLAIPIDVKTPDNGKHIDASLKIVNDLVAGEIKAGVPADRIVLAGFSQGAALALAASIQSPHMLAGCCCLSGWALPKQELDKKAAARETKDMPFFVGHGVADNVVLSECGKHVKTMLDAAAYGDVTLKLYPGVAHGSCPQEERDVLAFLTRVIG